MIGATPDKVARMASTETGLSALAGSLAGIGFYFSVIPIAARVRIGQS